MVSNEGGLQGYPLNDLAVEAGDDIAQHQPPVLVPGDLLNAHLLGWPVGHVQHQDALHPQLRLAVPTPRLMTVNSLLRGLAHVL